MPYYDYQCKACGHRHEQRHSIGATPKPCPECGSLEVEILITSAPIIAQGMLTNAGDSRGATKEQLEHKWREETPKLRKKLEDKLGKDTVERLGPSSLSAFSDD